jgi:hypothetical protein
VDDVVELDEDPESEDFDSDFASDFFVPALPPRA